MLRRIWNWLRSRWRSSRYGITLTWTEDIQRKFDRLKKSLNATDTCEVIIVAMAVLDCVTQVNELGGEVVMRDADGSEADLMRQVINRMK